MPQERNIVTNTSDALVARNQIGLEISGPNTEFSQTQELIENARNIAFFGRVKAGIDKFADYTGSLGKRLSPKNLMLLGGMGVTAVAVACGGGSESKANQVSANPDTGSSAPAVVRPVVESTPAPAVKAEAPKPNTEVLLSGPTEASKAKVRDNAGVTLVSVSAEISAIQLPPNVSLTAEGLKQVQSAINSDANFAKEALAQGKTDEAREALLKVLQNIRNLQKSGNTVVIPKEMKAQHDPADKYVKGVLVLDSGLFDYYFGIVDILVATDITYNGK